MPVGIRSISLAFFRPYRSGLLVPLNQTLEFPYWNHIWFVNQILLEKRFFMKPWGQEAVAPGLRLMVHQSSMNVSPAFRSASESFVAVKFSIFSSCKVFIFMIKFHSGNGTWRMLQMDCISKAVTCSDLSKDSSSFLVRSSPNFREYPLKVSPSRGKTAGFWSTALCWLPRE